MRSEREHRLHGMGLGGALGTASLRQIMAVLNDLDEDQARLALRLLRAVADKG